MKTLHTREFIEKLVYNDLYNLPYSLQDETIEKLVKYNNSSLSQSKIKEILNTIKQKYEIAQVEAGDAVGIIAAQSLAEPSTQMVLRTFHYAGVAFNLIIEGLDRIEEIVNFERTTNPKMRIPLNSSLSEKEVDNIKTKVSNLQGIKFVTKKKEEQSYVLYTSGSNLGEVLKIKQVERSHVFTNDIKQILSVLGIEAVRQSIIDQLCNIYEIQNLDIDPHHIILLADAMTVTGNVEPVTRFGIVKSKSLLARLNYEDSVTLLLDASSMCMNNFFNSIVDNLIVGNYINIGTGRKDIQLERCKNERD